MMKCCAAVTRILTAGALIALAGLTAAQQGYPSKPIRLITPYPPGGSANIVTRLLGQKLSDGWGQQVIVDNRPGGNTVIGTEALAKSPPDGYTIMLTSNTHVISPHLLAGLPYDSVKDFAPVATVTSIDFILVLHPSVPANTLQEFIALAKAKPGQLNHASPGIGGGTHLAGEFFNILAGVKLQHIPYKGGGPALTDLLGGQVQLMFSAPLQTLPYIKTGRLKAIAFSGEHRSQAMPQVPTFAEAGLPGFQVKVWQGVLAPGGTPREVVQKLSTEIAGILAMPEIREKLLTQGLDPFITTAEQFAALIKADMAMYARIVKAANIKLEQ